MPETLAKRSTTRRAHRAVLSFSLFVGAAAACSSEDSSDDPAGAGGSGGTQLVAGSSSGGALESAGEGGHGGSDSASGGADAGDGGTAMGGSLVGGAGASGESAAAGVGGDAGAPAVQLPGKEYPDVEFVYKGGSGPPLTPDGACALGSTSAVPAPLDMYVVFDRSGSMNLPKSMPTGSTTPGGGDCNVGDPTFSRWCHSINALDGFFRSKAAAGTGVALQFFPAGGCMASSSPYLYACCSSGSCCKGAAEALPAVPLAELPDARPALVAAMNAEVPWADRTPIEAALRGIISYTTSARRADRPMIGVLITDGGPEGCQSSAARLAELVAEHRERTGVQLYVIGTTGAAYSWLEPIAKAGGAPQHSSYCAGGVKPCHFYNVGSAEPDVFIDVLQQIRRSAIACSFEMPQNASGLIDPNEVQLSFTPKGGTKPLRIPRVQSRRACTTSGGFYYDSNNNPRRILMCPSSCETFRAQDGGKVEVLLGCQGS